MGAVQKASFSWSKLSRAVGVQDRDLGLFWSKEVSGAVRVLKDWMNR